MLSDLILYGNYIEIDLSENSADDEYVLVLWNLLFKSYNLNIIPSQLGTQEGPRFHLSIDNFFLKNRYHLAKQIIFLQ